MQTMPKMKHFSPQVDRTGRLLLRCTTCHNLWKEQENWKHISDRLKREALSDLFAELGGLLKDEENGEPELAMHIRQAFNAGVKASREIARLRACSLSETAK